MKFRYKVFAITIATYLLTLAISSVFITERSYRELLKGEIERGLNDEANTHSAIYLYLWSSARLTDEPLNLGKYADTILGLFASPTNYLELLDPTGSVIATNFFGSALIERGEEVALALAGQRTYVVRRIDGKRHLYISDSLTLDGEQLLITYIKDLTSVEAARLNNYSLFVRFGLLGLCVAAALAGYATRLVVRPIEDFTDVVKRITAGNYHERVGFAGNDEVGVLAAGFDTMAEKIEAHVSTLREENERKQQFINSLTHELRTPLTSIIGYAETLKRIQYDEQTFHTGLSYIESEGERLLRLAQSLLELIITKEKSLSVESCPLLPLLNEVAELIAPKANGRGIALKVEGAQTTALINRDLVKTCLLNLVDNALNASLDGFEVTLATWQSEGRCIVEIRDRGIGISQKDLTRIFEPFYRADLSRSRRTGGVGLGLSLCKEVFEKHGANIVLESEEGKGTVARILF